MSRFAFDVLTVAHDDVSAELRRCQLRYDELFRELREVQTEALRMKKAGYEPTPKDPVMEREPELPPAVLAAIEERALDPDMRRRLTRFAATALRRPEASPDDVAQEILAGEDLEEIEV